jgi:hypothetical protein
MPLPLYKQVHLVAISHITSPKAYISICLREVSDSRRLAECALYEELPFTGICRLKLYTVFVNGKNEAVIYRQ